MKPGAASSAHRAAAHHDAVVIGSGATGGWAAKQLTESGLSVALLEAGPSLSPGLRPSDDEPSVRQPIQSRSHAHGPATSHLFVDDLDNPYSCPDDAPFNWIRGRQVGGRLHTWGGHSLRMSDHQFKAASRDGIGEDWPISYADLAPHYSMVERYLRVAGSQAGLPHLPDDTVSESPPSSAEGRRFKAAVERRWPTRSVVPGRITPAPPYATLDAAERTGRLTLLPNSIASRVLTDRGGERACGVVFVDALSGSEGELEADVVFLCASTIESIRLLLNSASPDHPEGLGNSSGALGHFLMDHTYGVSVGGIVPRASGSGVPRHLSDICNIPAFKNVTEPGDGFDRGYGFQLHLGGAPRKRFHRLRRLVKPKAEGRFLMVPFGEVLPRFENYVSVDRQVVDAFGIPIPRIELRYGDNEHLMAADQLQCSIEMAEAAGFEIDETSGDLAPPGSSVHELGGARMGSDPSTSVLNRNNQSWDVPNLFVTDGACFTSSGFQNPTLTMMALTARACQFAHERLKAGSGFETRSKSRS